MIIRIVALVPLLIVVAIISAIFVQDFTDVLPLGLFNHKRELYTYLSYGCLGMALFSFTILIGEFWKRKRLWIAGIVRKGLFCLIMVELFIFGLDRLVISQNPKSRLGGPFYERQTAGGNWVILKKYNIRSPVRFRTDHPYDRETDRPRILFLGDSFTEGSGSSTACNYPNIVEEVLCEQLGDVEVMNAGVAAYGPVDASNLLELLKEEGYRFDALVYNVFTENDFTDNLPETERRVVGGMIYRFPHSRFLRVFHPLNSFSFRYGLLLLHLGTLSAEERDWFSLKPKDCIFHQEPLIKVSPKLRDLIYERLKGSQRVVQSSRAQQEFVQAIAAIKAEANKLRIPFVIVLFPDRVLVDQQLRERLKIGEEELKPIRTLYALVSRTFPDTPVLKVADELQGRSGMFIPGDTHLSDLGNVVAGSYVGRGLVRILAKGNRFAVR